MQSTKPIMVKEWSSISVWPNPKKEFMKDSLIACFVIYIWVAFDDDEVQWNGIRYFLCSNYEVHFLYI